MTSEEMKTASGYMICPGSGSLTQMWFDQKHLLPLVTCKWDEDSKQEVRRPCWAVTYLAFTFLQVVGFGRQWEVTIQNRTVWLHRFRRWAGRGLNSVQNQSGLRFQTVVVGIKMSTTFKLYPEVEVCLMTKHSICKHLESTLDCEEIKPVNPQENQSWIFIGRTDAEAETPICWAPDAKDWLIVKDPDAGEDWRQEKGTTEDEMVGWHHWLDGHEFQQAPGDGEDSEGWCAAARGVTMSWTWLSDWTSTTNM